MGGPTPLPGWYPDPSGARGRRYWDGQQWTAVAPDAPIPMPRPPVRPPAGPSPQKFKTWKLFATLGGVVVLLIILGNVFSSAGSDEDSSARSETRTSTRAATPTPTGPQKPDGVSFSTKQGPEGEVVTASFSIGDNFTKGMISSGARLETIDILEYAVRVYPSVARVVVQGSFPMKDAYGNTSTDVILNVYYDRTTLNKINFGGVDSERIWDLRDGGTVHPELQG